MLIIYYTKNIYFNDFKMLLQVDFMLGSYMEDINITSNQFEKACAYGSPNIQTQFHHNAFEQVKRASARSCKQKRARNS
jgi:hypothetical protein